MAEYELILLNEVMAHIGRADRAMPIQQLGIHGQRDFRPPVQSDKPNI